MDESSVVEVSSFCDPTGETLPPVLLLADGSETSCWTHRPQHSGIQRAKTTSDED